MALPIILPTGVVAVYGVGVTASTPQTALPSGIVLPPIYLKGTIYNIWDGGATYVYGGDVVYWKDGEQVCRIVTEDNLTYTLVKYNGLTKDSPLML